MILLVNQSGFGVLAFMFDLNVLVRMDFAVKDFMFWCFKDVLEIF